VQGDNPGTLMLETNVGSHWKVYRAMKSMHKKNSAGKKHPSFMTVYGASVKVEAKGRNKFGVLDPKNAGMISGRFFRDKLPDILTFVDNKLAEIRSAFDQRVAAAGGLGDEVEGEYEEDEELGY